tara:strand:- start:7346 stop:8479 length:1134 start_codon:yes stop_codon:yes gene_type:complete
LLVTFIPDFTGLSSSLFTNGIWLVRAIMAFWLIDKSKMKVFILRWEEKLFLLVAFIYFLNISIDVFLQNYPIGIGNPIDLIGFFLSILVAFSFRYDYSFTSRSSYFYFLITLSIGLVLAFFLSEPSPPPLVGRYDANSTVNTINYGKSGCALAIVAIYGIINFRFKYSKIIYIVLLLLGIISIMRAGTRSPVVILIVVVAFYFLSKYSFIKGFIVVCCTSLVLWFSMGVIIQLSEMIGSDIVTRLLASIESGDTSGRDEIYLNVINHIKDSPVFGSFYLISSGLGKGFYPHNFFLEAFMTTGFFGGIPFVFMVTLSIIRSFQILRQKHIAGWIVLLFLQALLNGMFSSTLYSAEDFWGLCFLVLSINLIEKNKSLIN